MRIRLWVAGVLAVLATLMVASTARATIIYAQGTDLWATSDTGTGAHLLVSASDIPEMATLSYPNILPNGTTLAFDATTNEYENNANNGDCGENCEGVYTLANGTVTASSGAPADTTNFTSEEYQPTLTIGGNVIFNFITVGFSGNPPTATGSTESIETRPLAAPGTTASTWTTQPNAGHGAIEADPANGSLLAYFTDFGATPPNELYVGDQSNSPAPTAVVSDPGEAYFTWNPAGTTLAIVDDAQAGQSDGAFSPGIWTVPDTANATPTEVLADPNPSHSAGSPGEFAAGITWAGSELVFTATVNGATNLWEVPSSCTAATCSFPGSATQLTTGGNDEDPTWTSASVSAYGSTQSGGGTTTTTTTPTTTTPATTTTTPTTTTSTTPTSTATVPTASRLRLGKTRVTPSQGFSLKATLSAAATVRITVVKLLSRHRRHTIGTVNEPGKPGPNTFRVKLVAHHRLTAGRYILQIVTVRGALRSKAQDLSLRVS